MEGFDWFFFWRIGSLERGEAHIEKLKKNEWWKLVFDRGFMRLLTLDLGLLERFRRQLWVDLRREGY